MDRMLIVNFKTYSRATGEDARELAERISRAASGSGKRAVVAPALQDQSRLQDTDLEVFSQHIDPVEPGSHTGHVLPEALAETGVSGTLLNHSERRLDRDRLEDCVERTRETGLTSVVCAQSPEECEQLSGMEPDFIAFEPPELIGGDTSVSEAKPELIEEAVKRSSVPVLTGAGIKSREDVERSVELGCKGVLVASGVVKAENPEEQVKELMEGL